MFLYGLVVRRYNCNQSLISFFDVLGWDLSQTVIMTRTKSSGCWIKMYEGLSSIRDTH